MPANLCKRKYHDDSFDLFEVLLISFSSWISSLELFSADSLFFPSVKVINPLDTKPTSAHHLPDKKNHCPKPQRSSSIAPRPYTATTTVHIRSNDHHHHFGEVTIHVFFTSQHLLSVIVAGLKIGCQECGKAR